VARLSAGIVDKIIRRGCICIDCRTLVLLMQKLLHSVITNKVHDNYVRVKCYYDDNKDDESAIDASKVACTSNTL